MFDWSTEARVGRAWSRNLQNCEIWMILIALFPSCQIVPKDLALLRYRGFTQLLSCRKLTGQDLKFCRSFWHRNASRLNAAQKQQVEELQAVILCSTTDLDRVALRPAVTRALSKFHNILERRHAEFLALGASSVTSLLFGRHTKKQDSELRACYWFVLRIFPRLNEDEQTASASQTQWSSEHWQQRSTQAAARSQTAWGRNYSGRCITAIASTKKLTTILRQQHGCRESCN